MGESEQQQAGSAAMEPEPKREHRAHIVLLCGYSIGVPSK
jgi:hypothetical protein